MARPNKTPSRRANRSRKDRASNWKTLIGPIFSEIHCDFKPGGLSAGCGKKLDEVALPKTDQAAGSQVEQAFTASNPQARQQSQAFSAALQAGDYEKALEAMAALRNQTAQNIQQVIAVENADRRLQADVLRGVEAGDPKAVRVWQNLKRARRK